MAFRTYTGNISFDEDAEDAFAFVPLSYPTVAVVAGVAAPTEELVVS
jgi:hypothetical protein